ncbi:hypothetical protein [Dactylosporangium sp. NPDC051541]|uniref:hypothetical protein n=1 Tax=Dactylosporangium sp. NPDC051541 TaxID=3363977 RepID=UPI00379BDE57
MRFLRGLAGAATVAVAGGLAVWAGQIGTAGLWRALSAFLVGAVAWVILTFIAPLVAIDEVEDSGCALILPAAVLILATVSLTEIDIEVHAGQWKPVVVMQKDCQSTDDGCQWRYRVHDARTEADLGWIMCDKNVLNPGDNTRIHVEPTGHHDPNLEPCAHTSTAWTTGLHLVWGVWGVCMLVAFLAALFRPGL